jgi:hypothetical protein
MPLLAETMPLLSETMPLLSETMPLLSETMPLHIKRLGRVFKPFFKHLSLWRSPQPPLERGAFRVSFPPFLTTVYTQVIKSLPVLELPHPNPPRMYWGGN